MRFCIDHGCDRLFTHKEGLLPPTMATGKLDRLDMHTRKYLEAQQTRLQDTYDETESNLVSTLKTLAKEELDDIDFTVLLGGFSGRFDHLLANLDGLMRATTMLPMPTMALHGHNLIMVVPEGEWTLETDRNMLSGTCGFAPLAQKKTMVTTEGFKYNLNDEELGFGKKISTSNEVEEDHFKMNCDAPMVFTMGLKKEMKLGV
uniref:Thiamine diphosphokinase n=1 Tax=Steinernema glaseri TaxID=37863 RepID=A0A1I7Z4R9_9BILA